VPWWDRCLNVSGDYMGGVICTIYSIHVLCVLQGQNKIFSISLFVTLFSEIILYMFVEVLIICLYPVRVIKDTNAYTFSLAFSCVPLTRLNFLESVRSV